MTTSFEEQTKVKIVLIGNSYVGKSGLVAQYIDGHFSESKIATVGIDFRLKKFKINDKKTVTAHIWDTAGSERYRSLTRSYYKADAIIMVYDITCGKSFTDLDVWYESIKEVNGADKMPLLLVVGNKLDNSNERSIMIDEGKWFAKNHGAEFCETSALHNDTVTSVFDQFILMVATKVEQAKLERQKIQKHQPAYPAEVFVQLYDEEVVDGRKCCK